MRLVFSILTVISFAAPVLAETVDSDPSALQVTIHPTLDAVRGNLSPHTGANTYKLDQQNIQELPQGATASLDKVLEQMPGVAQDSFGQTHVRGEHANLQYRLNGIILPEGISGFGQTLDPRMIESVILMDGALPAQYGCRTAGVVDIQTKSGFDNSGTAEMYGGSYGTIQPSISYGGTVGQASYFLTASHLSSDFGIEPPTDRHSPIHDHTEQNKQFVHASYAIDPSQRVEIIGGNSISTFQIPNNPGQDPQFTAGSTSTFDSAHLNERQFESNQYLTTAWQMQHGDFETQIAPYIRNSETHFRPDVVGDLVFNGIASDVVHKDLAFGVQNDNSWRVSTDHTLRAGFSAQQEHIVADNTSQVFPGSSGSQSSTTPQSIVDNNQRYGQLYGMYLQDEWRINERLTLNYGARFDVWNAYITASQLSPRLGLVYTYDQDTIFHIGYARYFTPPPLELVSSRSLSTFSGTTNAPTVTENAPVKPERTHSFDVGMTHQLTPALKLGVDAYYKISHNLLDEGQFGQALVFTPFNYEHGRVYGIEFTAAYQMENFKAYANFAASRAMGKNIVSAQFNFSDPEELAYIQNHWVHLDHDQTYTASAGASYRVLPSTILNINGTFGSGLRQGFANTESLAPYAVFDGGVTHELNLFPHDKTTVRFTILNIFDTPYELRSGDGIGVGAPQWGMRRGFFAGLSQGF